MSGEPRITDLFSINPEDIKFRNTAFLQSDLEYERTGNESFEQLRHDIWVTRNGDLRELFRQFPVAEPLHDQCAGWMHAVAGKHFFPDANHRTALATLRELLRTNGITPGKWPASISTQTVIHSHQVRARIEPVRLDTLYRKDRLFLLWLLYFKTVLKNPVR